MIPTDDWLLFAAAAFVLVLTPGPNMIYVVSRSVCQGRRAGVISLAGVIGGALVHMLAAAAGLSAILLAVPVAYEVLRWAGALYLLCLGWQAIGPGASSPFTPRQLPIDPPRRLFLMGMVTNLLNPKVAVFYLSIFPQFVSPARGSVFGQSLVLGFTQICVSFSINLLFVLTAAQLSAWFARNPRWLVAQGYVMGSVMIGLAVRLAVESGR